MASASTNQQHSDDGLGEVTILLVPDKGSRGRWQLRAAARAIPTVRRGAKRTGPAPSLCREAVAQLFRALAGGYELRADVDSVKRREGCSVRDCGELVAVQLGQVVCRHQ